jgi:hypothetical protein
VIGNLFWLAALNVLWLAAGLGVTGAVGWWSGRDAIRALGISYVAGVAAYGVLAQAALVMGAPMTRWQIVVLCAVLACGTIPAARREGTTSRALRFRIGWVGYAVIAVLALLAVDLWYQPLSAYDAWTFWTVRAQGLASLGGLDASWFTAPEMRDADYPLLLPALEAAGFRFTGYETALLDVQSLFFLAGMLLVWAEVVAPRSPRWGSFFPLLIVAAPSIADQLASAEADIPLATFFVCAAVCAQLWRRERSRPALILFGLFSAAAAATKVEGLSFVLALVVVFAAVEVRRAPRVAAALVGVAAAGLALGVGPWRVWLRIHHVPDQAPLSRVFDVGYLTDHASRLTVAVPYVGARLVEPSRWLLLVPLLCALTALAIVRGRRDAVAVTAVIVLALASLIVAYWTTPFELHYHLATSARRVITAPILAWAYLLPMVWGRGDP